jgi:hypothetical protein
LEGYTILLVAAAGSVKIRRCWHRLVGFYPICIHPQRESATS